MREQGEFKLSNWKEDPLNPKEASEATLKWYSLSYFKSCNRFLNDKTYFIKDICN